MEASIILPDDIPAVWPAVQEYLAGAAKYTYGRFEAIDMLDGLLTNKNQQLWIAFDSDKIYGAVITEVVQYPRMKALVMHFTGGEKLPSWKNEMLELLQRFAKDNNCTTIESYGRRGWERVFKNDGFKTRFMFYELPVEKQT